MKNRMLSNQEIVELVVKAQQEPDIKIQKKLYGNIIKSSMAVVAHYANKYKNQDSYEDLKQVGAMALYQATTTFNQSICPMYYGWVCPWVKSSIFRAAMSTSRYFRANDLSGIATSLAEQTLSSIDIEEDMIIEQRNRLLWNSIKDNEALNLLKYIYAEEADLTKTSRMVGISRYKAENLHIKTLKQLRYNDKIREIYS